MQLFKKNIAFSHPDLNQFGAWWRHRASRIWVNIGTADGLAGFVHRAISCANADFCH